MKSIKIITLCLCTVFITTYSLADEPMNKGEVLASQINVTKDILQQIISQMRNTTDKNNAFSNPDFIAKASVFNKKAEEALIQFELEIKPLIEQAQFYTNRLKALLESQVYSESQKKALYEDQLQNTKIIFKDLSIKYQNAIYKLFAVDFPEITINYVENIDSDNFNSELGTQLNSNSTYKFKVHSNIKDIEKKIPSIYIRGKSYLFKELEAIKSHDFYKSGYTTFNEYYYKILESEEYNKQYIQPIKYLLFTHYLNNGCYSSSCSSLYLNHRLDYINLVSEKINHDIDFVIFKIKDINSNSTYSSNVLSLRENRNKYLFKDMLFLNPSDIQDLPFDISERDYLLELRKEKITYLKELLLSPGSGIFSKWDCPTAVNDSKKILCESSLGCLSTNEETQLLEDIKNSDLFKKSKRQECLMKHSN